MPYFGIAVFKVISSDVIIFKLIEYMMRKWRGGQDAAASWARRTRAQGQSRMTSVKSFSSPRLYTVPHAHHIMGRPVLTQREKKRRSARAREDCISEGLAAVKDARRVHNKRGAAAVLLAANINASPATVNRRLAGGRSIQEAAAENGNLTVPEEQELAAEIRDASERRKGYRPRKILKLAMDIAQARNPQGPAPIFGKNWVSRYLARHDLRKYLSKKISNERSQSVHPRNCKEYFDVLEKRQERRQYKPCNKYGMDESPGMLGNGDALVVVGPIGKKAQYAERDGNRRSYTIVATICADGSATVKPWFIFKAKGFAKSWAENNSLDAQ
jgi:hypothetical protein